MLKPKHVCVCVCVCVCVLAQVLDGLISQVLDAPELTSGHMSDDTSEWVWDGPVCAVDTDGATGPQDLTSCLWAAPRYEHVMDACA